MLSQRGVQKTIRPIRSRESISMTAKSATAEFRIPRERMVDRLRDHYGIKNQAVLDAMLLVPRHIFVSEALAATAYADNPLPIAAHQTISQPFIVAFMTELLNVDKKSRVLEVGAGSGYQTAILAHVAGQVYSIERIAELAREAQRRIRELGLYNATVKCFDGTVGWSAHAPYDGILVAAGGPEIPEPLVSQLKIGGALVIPIGDSPENQRLIRVIRTEDNVVTEDHGSCSFVPLIGRHGWQR
jgi:protein-L-isoaspartate(D-aspartate) O-methyltransferase